MHITCHDPLSGRILNIKPIYVSLFKQYKSWNQPLLIIINQLVYHTRKPACSCRQLHYHSEDHHHLCFNRHPHTSSTTRFCRPRRMAGECWFTTFENGSCWWRFKWKMVHNVKMIFLNMRIITTDHGELWFMMVEDCLWWFMMNKTCYLMDHDGASCFWMVRDGSSCLW